MYEVDGSDTVVRLTELPQSDVGAPMPALAAAEHHLEVGYIARPRGEDEEKIAVVRFGKPYAHFFGPPNDEAFEGHPLAGRGLEPYGAFRVEASSWIRRLERMNSVHEYHRPEAFAELSHFVLTFHDTTFECVAASFELDVHPADEAFTLSVQVTP
jgi:hypothetical protein